MACDPLVDAFKDYGLNILRLPRADFMTLQVLQSDGRRRMRTIGVLREDLPPVSGQALPPVRGAEPVADIDVTRTRKLSGELAASFLGPILKALGLSPELSLEFARSKKVQIQLRDLAAESVRASDLADYLEKGVRARNDFVGESLRRDGLYVVTKVVKSSAFSTSVDAAIAAGIKAKVPGVGPVDVEVSADPESSTSKVLSFDGRRSLVMAFEAYRVFYDRQGITIKAVDGKSAYALPQEGRPERLILEEDLVDETE
jgi:hypothetical protein